MTENQSNPRGVTVPQFLVAVAITPFVFSSCLSRDDRETIEMPPAPVGDAAEMGAPDGAEDATAGDTGSAPAPAAPSEPPYSLEDAVKYVVESGDSLSAIADKFDVPMRDIMAANKISNPNKIRAGAVLLLPGDAEAAPAPEDGGGTTAPETGGEAEAEAEAESGGALTPATPDVSEETLPSFPSNE